MTDIKKYEPLWGSWYVDEKLGEGSFGKVYKVHKEEFGKIYEAAVKIISIPQSEADIIQAKSEGLNDESARSYFQAFVTDIIQEIDLMSAFRGNTNIVSLEDHKVIEKSGEIGWDILIRMELLNTLSSYVTQKPMTEAEVLKLGINICQALELCAKHNTIHRDIKPDNIYISQYGDYKLGDFGIARQIERTMSGLSKKGTYQYMAPEVFKGEEYGASVDTYSLGIVMYRFLNKNRGPFMPEFPKPITPNDRENSLRMRMSGEILPSIKNINPELNNIVLKACAYDRNKRFKDASEMKKALESLDVKNISSSPIIEYSEINKQDNNNTETEDGTNFMGFERDETEEETKIIFSQVNNKIFEVHEPKEPAMTIPEKLINKLSIFNAVFFVLLSGLTFLSRYKTDIFTFIPLYIFCVSESIFKFRNKILNYIFLLYLIIYLLFSILINFRLFDYQFLIFALSFLAIISSSANRKIFQIVLCVSLVIISIILGVLVLKINSSTHYTYVAGAVGIPFIILLNSPVSLLFGGSENINIETSSIKNNLGFSLLISLQFFTAIIFLIYLVSRNQLFYFMVSANFPGILSERFIYFKNGNVLGIILQIFQSVAFIFMLLISAVSLIPKHLNYAFHNERKIILLVALMLVVELVILFLIS